MTFHYFLYLALNLFATLFVLGLAFETTSQDDDDDDMDGGILQPVYVTVK